jgi:hypothetical protein
MVFKKLDHKLSIDFFLGALDLKKYVYFNTRKQIRQKMEGISAC